MSTFDDVRARITDYRQAIRGREVRAGMCDSAEALCDVTETAVNGYTDAQTKAQATLDRAGPAAEAANAAADRAQTAATAAETALAALWPVGAIYTSVSPTNPSTLFGGTWVAWGAGRVPVGVDATQTEFNAVEKTGGAKTHTLTTEQMPPHTHSYAGKPVNPSGSSGYIVPATFNEAGQSTGHLTPTPIGTGAAHNNLQPYITCYMWKRTA